MRVLVVSGIWPPDVGGPASHAPEVAGFLRSRGHEVEAVITADTEPQPEAYPVRFVRRSLPPGARHLEGVRLIAARARRADVVYTTGMFGRSSLGALLSRTPFVVKLTADPAYERARRWRLWRGSLEDFQQAAGPATLPLRLARDIDARRAAHVVTPSAYLRELALGWGVPAGRATVLPNPAPPLPELAPREELRRRLGLDRPTLVFAGRLTAQKSLDLGIEAARRAGIDLVIAGDGPDRSALERLGHARFLGPLPRTGVLELFRAGDASLLSSSWENFPHTVVEALAVGTPVIATRTGGVAEVVQDGVNGLIVEPGDVGALTAAITRFFGDRELAARLQGNAVESVSDYAPDRVYGRLEEILVGAAGDALTPRVLFVGRNDYTLPLGESLARKWDALSTRMDLRVLASGTGFDPRFRLVPPRTLAGPRFYLGLAGRVATELRSFRPDVVVTQSPFEAVAVEAARTLTRSPARLVIEVHGDWHTSTRLYGSPSRALLGPAGDRLAGWAVRRADAHRPVSEFTASLVRAEGREPLAIFTTYSDLGVFSTPPLPVPEEPRVVFVGVLERYKNVETLAAAWRIVARRVPEARLHLIGIGRQVEVAEGLVREGVEWDRRLEPPQLAAALDRGRALLLPSASEGLPRVAMEAFLRGRAVVGARAGGIPNIVEHDVNGLLVEPRDAAALAAAIERIVTDHPLAVRLGAEAYRASARWVSTPAEYADRVRAVVDAVLAA